MKKPNKLYLREFSAPESLSPLHEFPHDPAAHPRVVALKKMVRPHELLKDCRTEFEQVFKLAEFVSQSLNFSIHHPILPKYDAYSLLRFNKDGGYATCLNFGTVLEQLCHAIGIPARTLVLAADGCDVGRVGLWHTIVEYWDNDLQKWVWLDPHYHLCVTLQGKLLNFDEYFRARHKNAAAKLHFSDQTFAATGHHKSTHKHLTAYIHRYGQSMIAGHCRHFLTVPPDRPLKVFLQPGAKPYITLQGFALGKVVFVSRKRLYAPLNEVQISLESLGPKQDKVYRSVEHYWETHHRYFAYPKVILSLAHNMPWFEKYELNVNGRIIHTSRDRITIKLNLGKNSIRCRAVNVQGRYGPVSTAVMHYDSDYKIPRDYPDGAGLRDS